MRNIIFLLLLFACSISKSDIIGRFECKIENTTDVIILKENNIYIHQVFNEKGKLMYEGNSTWEINDSRITFSDFYPNEGYSLKEFLTPEQAYKFLLIVSSPIYKKNGSYVIEMNADEGIIYEKRSRSISSVSEW